VLAPPRNIGSSAQPSGPTASPAKPVIVPTPSVSFRIVVCPSVAARRVATLTLHRCRSGP
jgi:hypothetical protein